MDRSAVHDKCRNRWPYIYTLTHNSGSCWRWSCKLWDFHHHVFKEVWGSGTSGEISSYHQQSEIFHPPFQIFFFFFIFIAPKEMWHSAHSDMRPEFKMELCCRGLTAQSSSGGAGSIICYSITNLWEPRGSMDLKFIITQVKLSSYLFYFFYYFHFYFRENSRTSSEKERAAPVRAHFRTFSASTHSSD